MPHFFNLMRGKPLKWQVSEGLPLVNSLSTRISNIQLTHVPQRKLHAQPAVIRFSDSSVSCAFFDSKATGKIICLEQLYPVKVTLDLSNIKVQNKVPEEVKRIPVSHIPRHEENLIHLENLVKMKQPIGKLLFGHEHEKTKSKTEAAVEASKVPPILLTGKEKKLKMKKKTDDDNAMTHLQQNLDSEFKLSKKRGDLNLKAADKKEAPTSKKRTSVNKREQLLGTDRPKRACTLLK